MEAIVDLGVPELRARRVSARPRTIAAADCPMCAAGAADHGVLRTRCHRETDDLTTDADVLHPRSLDRLYATTTARSRRAIPSIACGPLLIARIGRSPGFCAAALAFGRVASVLNTIDTLFRIMGPRPAEYVRRSIRPTPHPELRAMVHRWTRGEDIAALLWILRQMLERSGSIEAFFLEGDSARRGRCRRCARQLLDAGAGARHPPRLRPRAEAPRRVLFLSAAVRGQRLQAAEPVPAVDGAARRGRSGRLDARVAGAADRAARHARDPPRPLPAADALHQPWLADGGRHHRVAAGARSRRSRALRFLDLPRRHDERLRLRPEAGRLAMSAQRAVPSAIASRATLRLIAALVLGVALGAAGAFRRLRGRPSRRDGARRQRTLLARQITGGAGARGALRRRLLSWNCGSELRRTRPGRHRGTGTERATRSCGRRTAASGVRDRRLRDALVRRADAQARGTVRLLTAKRRRPASRAVSPSRRTAAPPRSTTAHATIQAVERRRGSAAVSHEQPAIRLASALASSSCRDFSQLRSRLSFSTPIFYLLQIILHVRLQRDALVDAQRLFQHPLGAEPFARTLRRPAGPSARAAPRPSAGARSRRPSRVVARRHEEAGVAVDRRLPGCRRWPSPRSVCRHAIASSSDVPRPSVIELITKMSNALCSESTSGRNPASSTCFSRRCSLICRSSAGPQLAFAGDDEARVRHLAARRARAASIRCRCPLCGTSAATLPTIGA